MLLKSLFMIMLPVDEYAGCVYIYPTHLLMFLQSKKLMTMQFHIGYITYAINTIYLLIIEFKYMYTQPA